LKFGIGFFGAFGCGLEASQEIRNDLQGEHDGDERSGAEERLKICGRTAPSTDGEEQEEEKNDGACSPVLKRGAEANAAVIQNGEEDGHGGTEEKARQENGLAGDGIQHEGIE
jgi:hypothetical protein